MIDFRYHLVSLIAVFLALALGIVLGSGPLRDAIGEGVSGRTAALEQQVATLTDERDAALSDRDAAAAALDAAGAGLVAGTLPGYRVAVVTLAEVPADVRAGLDERLAQAGATVTAHVALTAAWTDPEQRSFRQGLVGFLLDYLDPAPPAGAGVDAELAQALVQGLVAADPLAPDERTENASVLVELLSTGETPLVAVDAPVTAPADAVVLLGPGSSDANDELATAAGALLRAAQDGSAAAVLAETGTGPGPLVAAVRDAADLATVSGVDGVVGQLGVPLALAERVGGSSGHYGPGEGLTPLPPRTVAAAPDRTPAEPATP